MSHDNQNSFKPSVYAKCVGCRHTWQMTDGQIVNANANGCAMCPKCGCVAIAECAVLKKKGRKR